MKLFIFALVAITFYGVPVSGQSLAIAVRDLGSDVNSKVADVCPFLSADGLTLYFISTRGLGKHHLYTSKRKSRDGEWEDADFFQLLNNPQDIVNSFSLD